MTSAVDHTPPVLNDHTPSTTTTNEGHRQDAMQPICQPKVEGGTLLGGPVVVGPIVTTTVVALPSSTSKPDDAQPGPIALNNNSPDDADADSAPDATAGFAIAVARENSDPDVLRISEDAASTSTGPDLPGDSAADRDGLKVLQDPTFQQWLNPEEDDDPPEWKRRLVYPA